MADEAAPGWDALEKHVQDRLGLEGEHVHWGSGTLPGQEGLYGVSAYAVQDVWLYLTFGLSELFEKESDDIEVSGWGIELTMRVPRTAPTPPAWPLPVLAQLGQHVFVNGAPFAPGHRAGGNGLSTDDPASALMGLAFAEDPQLGQIITPNGHVAFVTAVGVTASELERMRSTTTDAVLDELRANGPLLVTDPARS